MKSKSKNIVWHYGKLSDEVRARLLGQKGCVVWLTGLSGSGKSTVARELELMLIQKGFFAAVLDGDNVRHGLNANLGFSEEDRKENIRRIGEAAKLFVDANVIAVTAFISPYRTDRDGVRRLAGAGKFFEVHVAAPLEVCEARDPKGLYKKARAGEVKDFTGVTAPYEPPERPELVLRTDKEDPQACAEKIFEMLKKGKIL